LCALELKKMTSADRANLLPHEDLFGVANKGNPSKISDYPYIGQVIKSCVSDKCGNDLLVIFP
jgi:hypothetical protein